MGRANVLMVLFAALLLLAAQQASARQLGFEPALAQLDGFHSAVDQLDDRNRRAGVVYLQFRDNNGNFERLIALADAAKAAAEDRRTKWGTWARAQAPEHRRAEWRRPWSRAKADFAWLKVNVRYQGKTEQGNFGLIWRADAPHRLLDGANAVARADLFSWCSTSRATAHQALCREVVALVCGGYPVSDDIDRDCAQRKRGAAN